MATEIIREKDDYTLKPSQWSVFFIVQISLRFLAIAFTAIAIAMMVSSTQSVVLFGIKFVAKFKYSAAFRFKVGADAAVCGFTLVSLLLVYMLSHPKPKPKPNTYFYLLLHDMVMMVLVMAGSAAAAAVGYIGKHGQDETGWMAICDQVGKFCDKVSMSITFSFLAFFCLFILSVMAAYKLKVHTA